MHRPESLRQLTTAVTADANATLRQIADLTAAGCDIVRVAVPSVDDAAALPAIAAKSRIPVIADIHFLPSHAVAAIDAGCAAVRVNPGNIRKMCALFEEHGVTDVEISAKCHDPVAVLHA